MLTKKYWRILFRTLKNNLSRRIFSSRWGRKLLIESIDPKVVSMTMNCGDHVMTFAPTEYIGKKIYRKGQFERDHVTRLVKVLKDKNLFKPEGTLLELGGNIGTQTVYFALSKSYGQIVSVEPDPRNFAFLRKNIEQNNLQNQVRLVNCAAGENAGTIDFYQNQDNHGKSSAFRQTPFDLKLSVPVQPVREILKSVNTSTEDVALIWMDIEGYEPIACRSMQDLMSRKVPLYMEFSPMFYGPAAAKEFAQFLGGFYQNALVFFDNRLESFPTDKLPLHEEQFDVLFY